MNAIKTSKAEMNTFIAERRVSIALTRDIPPAVDRIYKLEKEVFV